MRFLIHSFIFLMFVMQLQSQTDDVYTGTLKKSDSLKKKPKKDLDWTKKLTYEANVQFQLSAYTFIYVSPTIGYRFTKKLNAGVGVIYNYISINYGGSYGKVSQSIFGGHSYARYFINDGFFVQAQYDRLKQPDVYGYYPERKKWVEYAMAGFGFRKPLGDRVGLSVSILYNLTPSVLSIYPTRLIVQFGFMGTF